MARVITDQQTDSIDDTTIVVKIPAVKMDNETMPQEQKNKPTLKQPIKIFAIDHRGSLKKVLNENLLSDFKALTTETFAPYNSAVLVDPEYGSNTIEIAKEKKLELLLTREKTGYSDTENGRELELYQKYTSQKLKSLGANAIKILYYYNSQAPNKNEQLQLLRKVKQETDDVTLPLLVEPITYPLPNTPFNKGEETIKAIKEIQPLCDILKLEFPTNKNFHQLFEDMPNNLDEQINAGLNEAIEYLEQFSTLITKPWVLLSRGMPFDIYVEALALSKKYGASGYAVGRAVWQEIADMNSDWNQIETFVKTTAKERMQEISAIFG